MTTAATHGSACGAPRRPVSRSSSSAPTHTGSSLRLGQRGVHGWLGVLPDLPDTGEDDWREIAGILADAYRNVAPRGLTEPY